MPQIRANKERNMFVTLEITSHIYNSIVAHDSILGFIAVIYVAKIRMLSGMYIVPLPTNQEINTKFVV